MKNETTHDFDLVVDREALDKEGNELIKNILVTLHTYKSVGAVDRA